MVLTPPPPTALWSVPVAELAGVARHVLDVTRAGVPGWRLVVLCPPGPLARELRRQGTAVVTGAVSPADGPITAGRTVRRILRRLRPDLLHTHLAFADLVGTGAAAGLRSARGTGIRLVSTEHGIAGVPGMYRPDPLRRRATLLAHRIRVRRADALIAVSTSTRDQVLCQWGGAGSALAERIAVVRNAVDPPVTPVAPRPGLRLLSLARLAPEKRIDRVLEAIAVLRREHPGLRLTIAGTGPEEPALRAQVARLALEEVVLMPGHVPAHEALAEHDVLVQLSRWENLSYAVLDAVAHGLGVVASDAGGTREIVPARCLLDPAEVADAAAVAAAMAVQGLEPAQRPARAAAGVAAMTAGIAAVYRGVTA